MPNSITTRQYAPVDRDGYLTGGVIILAAGFSRRFGSDKRLFKLSSGKTLLQATCQNYRLAFTNVAVVVRAEDEALVNELGTIDTVIARDADLGMGHSLASGVSAKKHWDFLFVALGDMPFISSDTLARLVSKLTTSADGTIVQPVYQGQPGHPVGFTPAHYDTLARLQGDDGARSVVANAGARVVCLSVDDAGVIRDIDEPPTHR